MSNQAPNTAGQPIAFVSAQALRARMHDAVNDPHLRQSFRGAMDFLMAKRAAQFPTRASWTPCAASPNPSASTA
jgi:L-lactate dehydrogenase complex protein LldF